MYRKTYVKIENSTLTNNVKKIINKYQKYNYYIGVVKANAYGHGDYIVNDLIKGGINYLAVSSLEEAISIRKYNQEIPILVLEPINIEYINIILENNITITIDSLIYTKKLIEKDFPTKLKVHIKLDTGMNRLGIKDKEEVTTTINLFFNHSGKIFLLSNSFSTFLLRFITKSVQVSLNSWAFQVGNTIGIWWYLWIINVLNIQNTLTVSIFVIFSIGILNSPL